ncbi:MAG TPA: CIA30 family protein [Burkholderiaceae bacterium]
MSTILKFLLFVVAAASTSLAGAADLPADGRISLFSAEKLASPLGAGWVASTDAFMNGKSKVTLQVQPADADGQAPLRVAASVQAGFVYPFAGLAFHPGEKAGLPANLGAYNALRFKVRGDGRQYQVAMFVLGTYIPANVAFRAPAEWIEVTMPFAQFDGIDPRIVTRISFNAGPELGDYEFQLKDVRLLKL